MIEKLRQIRKQRGLTLRQVELMTGISNSYLSQLETGKIKKPSHHVVQLLTEALFEQSHKHVVMQGWQEENPLAIFRTDKKTEIEEGMTAKEIAEIISDHLIKIVHAHFHGQPTVGKAGGYASVSDGK